MTPQKPVRTLIADDSTTFSGVVKSWIETRPELTWIGAVRSGSEVIDAVERLSPDLILVDAVMPGMDGFKVVRELKKRRHPVLAVVMSFEGAAAARRAAFDAGADGFIPKDEFAEVLELLLPELLEKLSSRKGESHAHPIRRPVTPDRP